jgi:hypothetical protein
VTREGIRPIGALLIAALAAIVLVACGSSDSTTSSSTPTGATTTRPEKSSTADSGSKGSQNAGSGGKQAHSSGSNGSGSKAVATPLEISGGGSEQFRNKGGDNSIQEFGEESGESELEEAAEAVHSFYVDRAERNWSGACTYLAKAMLQQLEQLADQSPQLKGKGCAVILRAFTRPLPPSAARETTVVDAGSLRTDGERSFLIYYGEDKVAYAMPLVQEDGGWKVALLSATPLG